MNTLASKALLKKLRTNKKKNGFTLVELMVVIVIVGVLTAVGLPQLQKSQNKAKSIAAQAVAVNGAKDCSTDLIFTTTTDEVTAVTNAFGSRVDSSSDNSLEFDLGSQCAPSGAIKASGGGDTWTVVIDANNIPGKPTK